MSQSYPTLSATELSAIANVVSNTKTNALVYKYYHDIIAAAHAGYFMRKFYLETDYYGVVLREELNAMERMPDLFPGIETHTVEGHIYVFSWSV